MLAVQGEQRVLSMPAVSTEQPVRLAISSARSRLVAQASSLGEVGQSNEHR